MRDVGGREVIDDNVRNPIVVCEGVVDLSVLPFRGREEVRGKNT